MDPRSPPLTLAQYQQQAFARHFVHDLNTPLFSVGLLAAVCAWLMYGRVPMAQIAVWLGFSVVNNVVREMVVRHVRSGPDDVRWHGTVLRLYPWSSLISGMVWAAFALLYIDTQQPLSQLLACTIMAGLIGLAVTPLSVHLPAFYAFVLPIFAGLLWVMLRSGGVEQLTLAGLTVVYFSVIARYAHDAQRVYRETVRLRFDNQRLIADLELRHAELESTSRNKSLFLAGVSHDLKQPIRAIGMYTGFLRHSMAEEVSPSVVIDTAAKIELAAGVVHRQINRLLELSRLESGVIPMQPEPLALNEVLGQVCGLLSSDARAHGVQLHIAPLGDCKVWADRRMLESILTNLLSNAIKHTPGGRVYVGTRLRTGYPEGRRLCIEVRDSGVGIAAHQIPLLFDAYRSFDDRQASESHGLGLAIAKAQAIHLGCDMDVRSQPGCGSTFTLCGLRTVPVDPAGCVDVGGA